MIKYLIASLFVASTSLFALDRSFEIATITDQRVLDFYRSYYANFPELLSDDDNDDAEDLDTDEDSSKYSEYFYENFPSNLIVKIEQGSSIPFEFDFDTELFKLEEPKEPLMLTLQQNLYFCADKEEKKLIYSKDLDHWDDFISYSIDILPVVSPDLKPLFVNNVTSFDTLLESVQEGVKEGVTEALESVLKDYYLIHK